MQSERKATDDSFACWITKASAFFLGGRRGTRTPIHFVNLTGVSKQFLNGGTLNQLETYYGYLSGLLSFM
jgi:hypothetical protein